MKILNLQPNIESINNDPKYIDMLESHLTYFRTLNTNTLIAVSNQLNYKYEGDFYGLLTELGVDRNHHYLVMRLNGLAHSGDYKGNLDNVLIPDISEVNLLTNIYRTVNI